MKWKVIIGISVAVCFTLFASGIPIGVFISLQSYNESAINNWLLLYKCLISLMVFTVAFYFMSRKLIGLYFSHSIIVLCLVYGFSLVLGAFLSIEFQMEELILEFSMALFSMFIVGYLHKKIKK